MINDDKIGIVTVTYNSEKCIEDFFDTLSNQTYTNLILYVVDNKSSDNTLAKCKEYEKKLSFPVKYILNDDNYGVAKGNNIGLSNALSDSCSYVLFSNNDVKLKSDTVENLYIGLNQFQTSFAAPKIFFFDTNKLWFAGGKFNKHNVGFIHIGYGKEDDDTYNKPMLTEYAPTCFLLVKSNVFDEIGIMDEKYFCYYDDADFMFRAKNNGYKVAYIPSSVLEHKEGFCTGKYSDFSIYYSYRNRTYFVHKYYKMPYLFFFFDLLYHYTVRFYKMRNNKHQWKLIRKALRDGYVL